MRSCTTALPPPNGLRTRPLRCCTTRASWRQNICWPCAVSGLHWPAPKWMFAPWVNAVAPSDDGCEPTWRRTSAKLAPNAASSGWRTSGGSAWPGPWWNAARAGGSSIADASCGSPSPVSSTAAIAGSPPVERRTHCATSDARAAASNRSTAAARIPGFATRTRSMRETGGMSPPSWSSTTATVLSMTPAGSRSCSASSRAAAFATAWPRAASTASPSATATARR